MNSKTHHISLLCFFLGISYLALSQGALTPTALSANSGSLTASGDKYGRPAPDSRGWTDPALNHNRLLQEQTGDGVYQLIGTFKVSGNQYLFGERLKGDMFSTSEKAYNIFLSYNTYNQDLGFFSSANPNQALVKEPGTLDSFIIKDNNDLEILRPMKFIYGSLLGTNDKFYYQELYNGKRYSLYKRYKSDLGYATSNYAQSDLRQFDLQIDYYYYNAETKTFSKLKFNLSNIIKEFKSVKDLSSVMSKDGWSVNPEEVLKTAFAELNK